MSRKIALILLACLALGFAGCTAARRMTTQPPASDLPDGFFYLSDAGNGYFIYEAHPAFGRKVTPEGYYLVSRQKQGSLINAWGLESNVFLDIVYIGPELRAQGTPR